MNRSFTYKHLNKNIMRNNLLLVCLLLLVGTMGYAQSSSKGKIMVEIDYGYAAFCGNSNLSPYGAHYRNAYNGGMLLNAELVYTFTGGGVGLRWTGITSSANYNLVNGEQIAEDMELNYIAPQLKSFQKLSNKWTFTYGLGAGYMFYKNKGLQDEESYKVTSNSWAANVDIALSYKVAPRLEVGATIGCLYPFNFKKMKYEGKETEPGNWDKLKLYTTTFSVNLKAYLW